MATYDENFVVTALPAGMNGTKLRIAVIVMPRLGSDAPGEADLNNWPDVRDWPSITPTWKVTVHKGTKDHVFDATETSAGTYDMASWQQLFPGTQKATPYQRSEKSKAPIFSYPVRKVIDSARELHTTVMRRHRTEFPSLEALEAMEVFQDLKKAADPELESEVVCHQLHGPLADDAVDRAAAFTLGHTFHGVRPCSEPTAVAPFISSLTPTAGQTGQAVEISGEDFLEGAVAVFDGIESESNVITQNGALLTATVPAGAGLGTIKVFVRNHDQLSNEKEFTKITGPK